MKPQIAYVTAKQLKGAFGRSFMITGRIWILRTLPDKVTHAVLYHELYHLGDPSTNCLWREIKANLYALWKEPLGQLHCVWLSLSRERLAYYWQRIKEGR